MKKILFLIILMVTATVNTADAHIEISNSWARLIPNGTGALFLDIKNSHSESDILIGASSPSANSVMLHKTQRKNDITHMKHLMKGINIPAEGEVFLKPGSYHIMLSGLSENLKLGDKIDVILEFKNNDKITVQPTLKMKPPFIRN
jgi:copper(I)-binding protein